MKGFAISLVFIYGFLNDEFGDQIASNGNKKSE
jgi:hypothetical protein